MTNFITLTGYYPVEHDIILQSNSIVGFNRNVVSENSKGSVVHVLGATVSFQVTETVDQIMDILNDVQNVEGLDNG